MPSAIRNPAVFPAFVAQHTVLFDPEDPSDLATQFPGLDLPESLARAVRKRQTEFLAGRYCAREALRKCAPDVADTLIGTGVRREPLWPIGIVGAITHTHGVASVGLARTDDARGIGLDIERVMSAERAENICGLIADPAELASVVAATGWSRAAALTAIFSAKETIFKCLYPEVQRYFDFRDAWVEAFSEGSFRARLVSGLTSAIPAGHALEGRYELGEGSVSTAMVLVP